MPRRTSRVAAVWVAAGLLASISPAFAAASRYSVPAGSMGEALQAYAKQTGVDVLFAPEAVAALSSSGAQGEEGAERALRRLVRGSGLRVRRIGPSAFVVARAAPRRQGAVPGTRAASSFAPPTEPPDTLDLVIVQARRRDERLIDVPASVSVVSSADLERFGGDGVLALRQGALGLTAAGQITTDTPTLVIRGQRRATSGESALSVITYLNEAPLPNNGSVLPLFDISKAQVLRGPQGVLFGRNTTGGALLIRTNEPGQDGYLRLATGSRDLREVELARDFAAADGVFAGRMALYGLTRDGLVENLGVGDDLDDRRQVSARLSLAYRPAGPLSALLVLDSFRAWETGTANILYGVYPNPPDVTGGGSARTEDATPYFDCGRAGCDIDQALQDQRTMGPRRTRVDLAPRSNRRNDGATLRLDWRRGDLDVRALTAFRRIALYGAQDIDGSPLSLNQTIRQIDTQQFTQELRVVGIRGETRWQAGFFYLDSRPNGLQKTQWWSAVTSANPSQLEFQYRWGESQAGFVDLTHALPRDWEVEAGFRYTVDRSSACFARVAAPSPDISAAACGARSATRSSAPSWSLGLTYRGWSNAILYAVTRRGYRAGGVNAPVFAAALASYQAYAPERVTDVELGFKWAATHGDWSHGVDAAAFVGRSDGIQRAVFPPANFDLDNQSRNDPPYLIINAGAATIGGLETEVRARRTNGPTFTLTGTLTRARFTSLAIPAVLASLTPTNPTGLRFSYTPPYSLRAAVEWPVIRSPRLGRLDSWADLYRSGPVRYVERAHDTNGLQRAYSIASLGLVFRPPGRDDLKISATINNLFDKAYAAGGGAITPGITATSMIYGEPRLVQIAIRQGF
ncbi:TonB-dependent receptor [Caulobacter sp. BK020]|uniref:TonB-dependent receptor plug domain-containing protein n=1 Tax=Caulobacter sp. BK020 TaxID=2512117 RepID=UPI0010438960|nr:TonB-dependent receptor [Caulobacter sp. BK020]TCS15282.1 outer membrane receptor protein involved in Fe transport [Caulobacter sp. BK020]